MKNKPAYRGVFGRALLLFLLVVGYTSCEFYHFTEPQPYDRENLLQFPDALLGKWITEPDTTSMDFKVDIPLKPKGGGPNSLTDSRGGEGRSFYLIQKGYLLLVFVQQEKILMGAWPRYRPPKGYEYPPFSFSALRSIRYDSLDHPLDTTDNYILQDDRIYEMDGDRFLNHGYGYTKIRDTLLVDKTDSVYVDLGHNAFLRRLTDSLYVLNLNSAITSTGNEGGWWVLNLLEIRRDGKLARWECNEKTGKLDCLFYERNSKYSQYYFNCRWKAETMMKMMKEGYWSKGEVMRRGD